MDIYVYSDESGVFDKRHNDYFVFGGLIFLSKEDKDNESRKYRHVESIIECRYKKGEELKASILSNKDKGKIYRSLNKNIKFAAVVKQKDVLDNIYAHKKSKQRYLDYVFKIALKRAFQKLIEYQYIIADEVDNVHIFCDEHATATDGRYELKEALEQEFKIGTFNMEYRNYYPPIFSGMKGIELSFKDSKTTPLIRAADIVANRIYNEVVNQSSRLDKNKLIITFFPR